MALQFGNHPDVVFSRAPLQAVLCQIRFPPILALMNIAGLTGLQTLIREDYPVLMPAAQGIRIRTSPDSIGINTPPPVWKLQDQESKWVLSVAIDFITLESFEYSSFDEFQSRFNRILWALRRTLRPANSVRIGLRKVNLFKPSSEENPLDYNSILRSELLGLMSVRDFPAPIHECVNQLQFLDGDNLLLINSGKGFSNEGEPRFILDLDYSTEKSFEIKDGEEITTLLEEFSQGMTNFFHWAVLEDYKRELQPQLRIARGN